MKKVILISLFTIISVVVIYFIVEKAIIQSMTTDVSGKWELVNGDGCFSEMTIRDGPKEAKVLSFMDVNEEANEYIVYRALYAYEDNTIHINEVVNFDDVDPFTMKVDRTDQELETSYTWQDEDYVCTYEELEEK